MALLHFILAASLVNVKVSSILKYPDASSLFTLSLDSCHPSFLQRTYFSSAMASSVVHASIRSLSRASLSFCHSLSQYISSISALVSMADFPFKSCFVKFSLLLQFFNSFFDSDYWAASFFEETRVFFPLINQEAQSLV